jgi:hypothetical protein
LRRNYVGDDSRFGTLSYMLAPGASAQALIFDDGTFHMCFDYGLLFGSDAPFATARPEIGSGPVAGAPVTTTNGAWGGAPTFAYAWLRCDAAGCAPIAGAASSSYTPSAADVGSTLRSRVTATQGGRSASSDSTPSGPVAAAPTNGPGGGPLDGPGGGPGGGSAGDTTGPTAKLALKRTTLQKVLKSGRIPITVTCDEACALTLRADVTKQLGKRLGGVKIASGKGTARAGRKTTLNLKLTRKARKALRRQKSLAFTLKATATDVTGNRATARKKARIRRRP